MNAAAPEGQVVDLKLPKLEASIFADPDELDPAFVEAIRALEKSLELPVVMLIQNSTGASRGLR